MNIILIGPPGAGKGTQAEIIAKKLSIPHISTGDIFRQAIAEGTGFGLKAKSYMNKGELVPDEIVIGIVVQRLEQDDTRNGFILDGFPRTLQQAAALDDNLQEKEMAIDIAIEIVVDEKDLVARLTGRRACRDCGANYHIVFNPPSSNLVCDNCGGTIYQRDDDRQTTVRQRLDVYKDQTQPLVSYYEDRNLLVKIDGSQYVSQVTRSILDSINQARK